MNLVGKSMHMDDSKSSYITMWKRMIKCTTTRIPYMKIGYLLEFSMAYPPAMDATSEKYNWLSMRHDLIKGSVCVFCYHSKSYK